MRVISKTGRRLLRTNAASFAFSPRTSGLQICQSMGAKKWYAVRECRQRGVWDSWNSVSPLVTGVPGSVYRSFPSMEEAEAWVCEGGQGGAGTPKPTRFYGIRFPPNAAGVYQSWEAVKPLVHGVSGAVYKGGFTSGEDALAWVREVVQEAASSPQAPQAACDPSKATASRTARAKPSSTASPAAQETPSQADVPASGAQPMELPLPKARIQPSEWYCLEFDGGSRGNPGPAGYGSVLRSSATGQLIQVVAGIIPYNTTNNQAEYSAVLAGLKAASALGVRYVSVQGDSELIVRQLTGIYKASEKGGLAQRLAEAKSLLTAFQEHRVKHVYREENKDADLLGNLAMDVLRLVPSRPSPTSPATESTRINAQVQQLLQTASQIPQHLPAPSCAAGSSRAAEAAGGQAGQPEHVDAQLRAVVLRQLLHQWLTLAATFEQVDDGKDTARREISRPVVIDLALPCEVLGPAPADRGMGSGSGEKGKGSGKRRRSSSKGKGA